MKRLSVLFIFLSILVLSVSSFSASSEEYRLDAGDVLGISVWGYQELQMPELMIRPDGKIAIPLVGEITAVGLTPAELTATLTKALSDYIKDPKVTLNVVQFRTTRVYVLGEVGKPGLYELVKEHRVLDALSSAGGFTKLASKSQIYLIRSADPDNFVKINLMDILKKGDLRQNYVLNEGDLLYLARGRIDFATDIFPIIEGLYFIRHF